MLDRNTQEIIRAVVHAIAEKQAPGTPIIDLGCGEGWLLEALAKAGFTRLTGVGYRVNPRQDASIIDGVDLCTEGWAARCLPGTYQVAVATEVIEHLTNPFLFLSQARQLLRDDGMLILTFPNVHNWRSIIGYALTGRLSGFFGPNFNDNHPLHDQHIFIPNIHLIRYLLKVAGFTVTAEQYINGAGRLFSQTTLVIARRIHA